MAWSHRKNARHRISKKDVVRKAVCNKTKRKTKNEMAGWRIHGPEKDGNKWMERQSKGSRGLEAYCKGGQGPPRAVAPPKKKKKKVYAGFLQQVISLLFASLCYCIITRFMLFYIFILYLFSCSVRLFSVLCVLWFFVLFCVFHLLCITFHLFVYNCLFPVLIQVYRSLPPGGNPVAVNKYRVSVVMIHIVLFNWHVQQKEVRMICRKFISYTGWLMNYGHNCRKWFPWSLWTKSFI